LLAKPANPTTNPFFHGTRQFEDWPSCKKFGGGLYTGSGKSREYPRDLRRAFQGLQAYAAWPARASGAPKGEAPQSQGQDSLKRTGQTRP